MEQNEFDDQIDRNLLFDPSNQFGHQICSFDPSNVVFVHQIDHLIICYGFDDQI